MVGRRDPTEQRRRQAADWVARRRGEWTPELERAFQDWCSADPANRAAFERVQRSYDGAALLRHSRFARGYRLPERPVRTRRPVLAAAMSIALVVAGAAVLLPRLLSPPMEAVLLATGPSETRRLRLADGSAVTLGMASRLRVELTSSSRAARIEQGHARLAIAPGSRPFAVTAGAVRLAMKRGEVEARASGGGSVLVLAGFGEAMPASHQNPEPTSVGPGERATVVNGQVAVTATSPRKNAPAGLLEFNAAPLAAVARAANPQSGARQIRVASDAEAIQVTGLFRAGDTLALAQALAAALQLQLVEQPDGSLLLRRPPKKKGG